MNQRCPDCDVTAEEMEPRSAQGYAIQLVSDESREGILGKIGLKESYDATSYVCPECGLTRLYADISEE